MVQATHLVQADGATTQDKTLHSGPRDISVDAELFFSEAIIRGEGSAAVISQHPNLHDAI